MADDDGTTDPSNTGPGNTGNQLPPQNSGQGMQGPSLEDQLDNWKRESRKHESGWRQQTKRADTAEAALADLQSKYDTDTSTAIGDLAVTKLEVALARRGLDDTAIAALTQVIDRTRLLKDGKPNGDAIKALAETVPAAATTGPPDPDQGRRNGEPPKSMNQIIRAAAGLE